MEILAKLVLDYNFSRRPRGTGRESVEENRRFDEREERYNKTLNITSYK